MSQAVPLFSGLTLFLRVFPAGHKFPGYLSVYLMILASHEGSKKQLWPTDASVTISVGSSKRVWGGKEGAAHWEQGSQTLVGFPMFCGVKQAMLEMNGDHHLEFDVKIEKVED